MKKLLVCLVVLAALPAHAQIGKTWAQVKAEKEAAAAEAASAGAAGVGGTAGAEGAAGTAGAAADGSEPSLSDEQRSTLQKSVYNACYQQAHLSVEMNNMSQKLKVDVPTTYCTCVSTRLAQGVTDDDMKFIATNKRMSPDLTKRFTANSQACVPQEQAQAQHRVVAPIP